MMTEVIRSSAIDAGATAFFVKPVEDEEFLSAIDSALSGGSVAPPRRSGGLIDYGWWIGRSVGRLLASDNCYLRFDQEGTARATFGNWSA